MSATIIDGIYHPSSVGIDKAYLAVFLAYPVYLRTGILEEVGQQYE